MKKIITYSLIIFLIVLKSDFSLYSQWQLMSSGNGMDTVLSIGAIGNNLCAGTYSSGVKYSTNNGVTWIQSSLNGNQVRAITVNGSNLFAVALYGGAGILVSTNNGANWTTSNNQETFYSLGSHGNYIYAGTASTGNLWYSTNGGTNWALNSLSGNFDERISSFAFNGNNTYAGDGYAGAVAMSTNNGNNWTSIASGTAVLSLAYSGNNLIAGTYNYAIALTTNNGITWTGALINDNSWDYSLAVTGNSVFVGTANGVFVSNNNGNNWTQRNEGLGSGALKVYAVYISGNYVYAGTYGGGIYKRPLNEVIGIKQISEQVPVNYSLSQNYPNPFNPSTKIKFELPGVAFTELVIYDALGKQVETIVNENLRPGVYEAEWNAANYPSGVYFYKLTVNAGSGNFVQTKKMILSK